MSLLLCIESSATPYGVVLAKNGKIIFDATLLPELAELKDVALLAKRTFAETDYSPQQLSQVAVNCGPGGTSAIRAGVSFANSLAYSLKIPVADFNIFELLGFEGYQQYDCPVLTTVKSIKGNAYVGWYENGSVQKTAYGPMAETVRQVAAEAQEWTVAGAHREQIVGLFPERQIHDLGKKFGAASTMVQMSEELNNRKAVFPKFPQPITEQSNLFGTAQKIV
jgi:tRNA A37 threonylcarbamoyladenosine modification protein TsaB